MNELERKPHQDDPWTAGRRGPTPPAGAPGSGDGTANYAAGVLGAVLGALVGALPTLLTGLFGFVSGWLALLIPVGARKGYQMFHGPRKTGFAFPLILAVSVLTAVGMCFWLIWPYDPLEAGLAFFLIPILFSIFGAFGCRQSLKLYTEPGVLEELTRRAQEENATRAARETRLYPADKKWTTPLRVSMLLSMFPELGVMIACLLLAIPEDSMAWIMASLGACMGLFGVMFALIFPLMGQLQGAQYLYVRTADGRLWRVMFARLNAMDTYRFTRKNGFWTALTWEKLDQGERELLRASLSRAIEDLTGGQIFPGSMLSRVVIPMEEVTLRKENRWCWKIAYRDGAGKPRRATIPKTYPGLCPVEGREAPQGPMPYRWGLVAVCLAVTLALGAAGWGFGRVIDGPAPEVITARIPEASTAYEHDGVRYRVDSEFIASEAAGFYTDPKGKQTIYLVQVLRHCGPDQAAQIFTGPIAEARKEKDFEGFRLLRTDGENTLVPLENTEGLYNEQVISFRDGARWYTGAVLFPDGTLVTLSASGEKQDEERTLGSILYILQSIEVTLTGENYQELFQPTPGYDHVGIAYYRTADQTAFVDAYLPYGGELSYNADGTMVTASAHGMTVSQTMATTGGNAQTVVDGDYAALAAEGLDLYADGTSETHYVDSYDIAYKQVTWFEANRTKVRVAILYADTRGEGNYLSARIIYRPEAFDEDYPALLEELGDVFALSLPQLDPME